MSHTLTQPEEVNLAILELESLNRRPDTSATNHSQQTSPTIPNYGYVSPYRAAHIRSMQSHTSTRF